MKIGTFGGTFDPIHNAHLIIADRIREELSLDTLVFMPAAISPHKQNRKMVSPNHRLNMIKKAISSNKFFDLDEFEIQKGGVSYTIDTIEYLVQKYELDKKGLYLIIGADNLKDFHTWHKPEKILHFSNIVVANRPHYDITHKKESFFKSIIHVKTPLLELSSTDIRSRIRQNKSVMYMIPQSVHEYILKFNLYH